MEILKGNEAHRESGAKLSSIKYFTDTKPVDKMGRPLPFEVAMVAKCVAHYRKYMKPLKTIWLCPAYYNKFTSWARRMALEMEADMKINLYTFDGVEIEMMGEHHILKAKDGCTDIDWDFYKVTQAEA